MSTDEANRSGCCCISLVGGGSIEIFVGSGEEKRSTPST